MGKLPGGGKGGFLRGKKVGKTKNISLYRGSGACFGFFARGEKEESGKREWMRARVSNNNNESAGVWEKKNGKRSKRGGEQMGLVNIWGRRKGQGRPAPGGRGSK